MVKTVREPTNVIYPIDSRPTLRWSVSLGFQHVLAMFMGSITGGVVIGSATGLDPINTGRLISTIYFAMGIATLLQVTIGSRLPIVQGSSTSFVPAYFLLGKMFAAGNDPITAVRYIMGGLMLGALVELVIGWGRVVRWLQYVVSPLSIGVIIALIGLGLYPVVNSFVGRNWVVASAVAALIFVFSFVLPGHFRMLGILLSVVVAYLAVLVGTVAGYFPAGHPLSVNLAAIGGSAWLTVPRPFMWGAPKFHVAAFLGVLVPYLVSIIESIGDYHATASVSGAAAPTSEDVCRGIGAEGAGCLVSATLGGTATTSFSQNIGVIAITGVASRYVVVMAGFILMVLGLFTKLGTVLATIPRPLLGGVYLVVFGTVAIVGFQQLRRADIDNSRNAAVVGTSLLVGLAVPAYVAANPIALPQLPTLQSTLSIVLGTPMAIGGLVALLLDNLLPGDRASRGLAY
ncbi:MAG: solute carrier family 23 protein [Bacillota bacterium]